MVQTPYFVGEISLFCGVLALHSAKWGVWSPNPPFCTNPALCGGFGESWIAGVRDGHRNRLAGRNRCDSRCAKATHVRGRGHLIFSLTIFWGNKKDCLEPHWMGATFRLQKVKKQREAEGNTETWKKTPHTPPVGVFLGHFILYKTGENWKIDLFLAHWLRLWPKM